MKKYPILNGSLTHICGNLSQNHTAGASPNIHCSTDANTWVRIVGEYPVELKGVGMTMGKR